MASRTIAIMEDVYDRLKALKAPEESFSDELRRLMRIQGSIMDLAGAWRDLSDEEAARIHDSVESGRKTTRIKELKKLMDP